MTDAPVTPSTTIVAPSPSPAPAPTPATPAVPVPAPDPATPPAPAPTGEVKPPAPAPVAEPLTIKDITVPEGYTLDEPIATRFLGILNDTKLDSKARMQSLFELQRDFDKVASERGSQLFESQQKTFRDETAADPTVGGQTLETKVTPAIGMLLDRFGNDEVRQAFEVTGLGNRLPIVKFLYAIAQHVGEPAPPPPPNPGGGNTAGIKSDTDIAASFYTKTP